MPESGEQRLYFLLQRAAHQLRVDADRRCLAEVGITTAQLGALFAIEANPGTTQQRLAHTLGQRESAITTLVGRLTTAGLVSKSAHPEQHRAVVLELTKKGAKALTDVRPEMEDFNANLRATLGSDFDRVTTALGKIADTYGR
ncbi:MarR family transcriptional regulator [Prauserella marina]|uniref:DNA-binding transcriptional regulator, MarR family n=1 Tax=Prauserella marina TaxID=530584 RepID=A0A222VVA1_9PSEU|nr:MarR family winged helix-turn-helix transcriptional regulator [Prauserella marina]ASR37820.1 MarR family transcriptional regulator [Prauserella marina]PWV75784.1 DNA-binding MarR family transcriptional regulator [Prauserella marina]SDD26250.1 DNA-binding transcriptional regulator, MarR family [Prauserella marina]